MLDLSSDGEPEAFFTTDYNGANAESMHIQLGKLQLSVEQPGATAATSIGTGAMIWQAGPALATALVAAAQKKSSVLPSDLSSIRAIELGCGCSALPSVALAVAGASHVTATDAADVLETLETNLAAYAREASRASVPLPRVTHRALQWDDREALAAFARDDASGFNIVLCADVDYAETLHEMLLDTLSACLAVNDSVAIIASAARCQRTLRLFLEVVKSRGLSMMELNEDLEPLPQLVQAPKVDGVRFFAARWMDESTARAAKARLAPPAPPPATPAATKPVVLDAAVDAAMAELDALLADDDEEEHDNRPPPPPPSQPTAAAPSAASAWTRVAASSTATFLERCARHPDRFFYPCNAKEHEPRRCVFELLTGSGASAANSIWVHVAECEYSAGGTGYRLWPCALLLACWLSKHASEILPDRAKLKALELGCGVGLPGLAAAALGADAVLSDCLPRLLKETVSESIDANNSDGGGGGGSAVAALLDWDEEAPHAAIGGEVYSTEQGLRGTQDSDGCGKVASEETFHLILASDVVYSLTHAKQLPIVVSKRLAKKEGGTFAAMVPVRSKEHTKAFLNGLAEEGLAVMVATVDAAWVRSVVANTGEEAAGVLWSEEAALSEGEVLFVRAHRGR